MRQVQPFQPGGLWLVTTAAILWGTIGVATQAIYHTDHTSSLFINLARLVIATPVLFAACWRSMGPTLFQIRPRGWCVMLLTGALLATSHAAYFAAIRYSGVTIATLLTICVAPVVVTGLSVVLKLETITRQTLIALTCALVGSVLLVGLQMPATSPADFLLGALFALAAALTYAAAVVGSRFLAQSYHPLQVTTISFGAGTLVLLAVNLASGFVTPQSAQSWLLIAYLGLVPTALAYGLFQTGLRAVPATVASIISMLDPVVAAALAWILFGEKLTLPGFVGAVLLILSIGLLAQRS